MTGVLLRGDTETNTEGTTPREERHREGATSEDRGRDGATQLLAEEHPECFTIRSPDVAL